MPDCNLHRELFMPIICFICMTYLKFIALLHLKQLVGHLTYGPEKCIVPQVLIVTLYHALPICIICFTLTEKK